MNNKLERLQMVFGCLCLLKKTKDKELRHNLKKKREAPSKRRKLGQYVIISQVHFLNWSLKKVLKKHWFGDFNSAGTRANFDNNCGCWKHNAWDGRVSTLKHANTRCLHEHMPTHVLLAKKKVLKTQACYTHWSPPLTAHFSWKSVMGNSRGVSELWRRNQPWLFHSAAFVLNHNPEMNSRGGEFN